MMRVPSVTGQDFSYLLKSNGKRQPVGQIGVSGHGETIFLQKSIVTTVVLMAALHQLGNILPKVIVYMVVLI